MIVVVVSEVRGLTVLVRWRRAPDRRRTRDDVDGSESPTTKGYVERGTITVKKVARVESRSGDDAYAAEDRICVSRCLHGLLG